MALFQAHSLSFSGCGKKCTIRPQVGDCTSLMTLDLKMMPSKTERHSKYTKRWEKVGVDGIKTIFVSCAAGKICSTGPNPPAYLVFLWFPDVFRPGGPLLPAPDWPQPRAYKWINYCTPITVSFFFNYSYLFHNKQCNKCICVSGWVTYRLFNSFICLAAILLLCHFGTHTKYLDGIRLYAFVSLLYWSIEFLPGFKLCSNSNRLNRIRSACWFA